MSSRRSSYVRIGLHAQHYRENVFHDAAALAPFQAQKRMIEGRTQPSMFIGIDRGVGKPPQKCVHFPR